MSKTFNVNLSFIESEYFKNELEKYLKFIFEIDLNIRAILLFGSVATGKARNDDEHLSDIDLVVISDDLPKDLKDRKRMVLDLTRSVSSGIQVLWLTSQELKEQVNSKFYLVLDAFDEGIILFDPENFLYAQRKKLFKDLKKKGVIKTELYWQWPKKKFGEKFEY